MPRFPLPLVKPLLMAVLATALSACGAPADPAPPPTNGDPGPVEPGPQDPAPRDPDPTDPDPTDPSPTDPHPPPGWGTPGTTRVSVHSSGALAHGDSFGVAIDGTGRLVAFASAAPNLVDHDVNGVPDVFVHDRAHNRTTRVSVSSAGAEANGASYAPSLGASGRLVAFVSDATNLVPRDTNGLRDVFLHDRDTGATVRVSVDDLGNEAQGSSSWAILTADEGHVFFHTSVGGFPFDPEPGWFVRDLAVGTLERVAAPADTIIRVSGDGRSVLYNRDDVEAIVVDRATGSERSVTLTPSGQAPTMSTGAFSLSPDGRWIGVQSLAPELVDALATNGRAEWHAFLHDDAAGVTELVSVDPSGAPGDARSLGPIVSDDGRSVLFTSLATNLVPGDTHVGWSLYVRDRATLHTTRLPVSSGEDPHNPFEYALSGDGRHVAFTSYALIQDGERRAGVEGINAHPDAVVEVFVHTLAVP